MTEEAISIRVDQAVTLEGRFAPGEAGSGGALIMHPHPQYGGSMANNVVLALAEAAREAGLASLRFNFRGVGRSSGSFDQGRGEKADALAAAAELARRAPGPQVIMGYSFGSLVGSAAALEMPAPAAGVWISPPLILGPLSEWPPDAGPLLVMVGDHDEYTQVAPLRSYVADLGARGRFYLAKGGDHFWWGGESVLKSEVAALLKNRD